MSKLPFDELRQRLLHQNADDAMVEQLRETYVDNQPYQCPTDNIALIQVAAALDHAYQDSFGDVSISDDGNVIRLTQANGQELFITVTLTPESNVSFKQTTLTNLLEEYLFI